MSQSSMRSTAYIDLDCGDGGIPKGGPLLHAAPNSSRNIAKIFSCKIREQSVLVKCDIFFEATSSASTSVCLTEKSPNCIYCLCCLHAGSFVTDLGKIYLDILPRKVRVLLFEHRDKLVEMNLQIRISEVSLRLSERLSVKCVRRRRSFVLNKPTCLSVTPSL